MMIVTVIAFVCGIFVGASALIVLEIAIDDGKRFRKS